MALLLEKRLKELNENSQKNGTFYFTDFLSQAEVSEVMRLFSKNEVTLFGGAEGTERMMARFGDPEAFGYDIPFPIVLLRICPLQSKFADVLTHRDFLGALMNLGIERDVIGDIVVREHTAYVFVEEKIAAHIENELTRVKHTPVDCSIIDVLPEDAKPRLKEMDINVSSLRLDGIVAHVFNMSRGEVKSLFSSEKVSVGGFVQKSAAKEPSEDDVISVRGYGKFKYKGISHETKKGHYVVKVLKYV